MQQSYLGFINLVFSDNADVQSAGSRSRLLLALRAAAVVGVEEVLIIVLVTLPLVEREADRKDNHDQDDAERVIVDTEGLARTLTARLIARQRTEVQRAVYAEHRLCVCRLRLESHSSCCGRRWNRLDLAHCALGCVLSTEHSTMYEVVLL